TFLACRTSEVKAKNVTFERRKSIDEKKVNLGAVSDTGSSSNEDTITISGRIIKLKESISIKKFDNSLQKKVEKKYRTGVLANSTGAVIIMLWENMANEIKENDYVILRNMRRSMDGNSYTYFSTTFRTECINTTNECDDYDEESALNLLDIEITLFKTILCTVDSVLIDILTICPRCKTRSTCNENLAVCSNVTCGATFKTKSSSIRADLIVTETG
ncbi:unnamed protein product, partial [Rotaria sordida]